MGIQSFSFRPALLALIFTLAVSAAPCVLAVVDSEAANTGSTTAATAGVDPAAAAAIAVIERFSAALATGQIDQAAALLDPAVIVLESGGVEQSRDEYLASHAKADAEFLKGAQVTLRHRRARASGDLAWVASESQVRVQKGADAMTIDSTETMVLEKAGADWKIVHIHWSARRADAASAEIKSLARPAKLGALGSGEAL